MATDELLTIGQVAERTGTTPATLRFYEDEGLITAERSPGNQRRYRREELRRIAFVRAGQTVGLTLAELREALDALPDGRTPTMADWRRLSKGWRQRLDDQIGLLERLRDDLASCIGCGCLSLQACRIYNPDDVAATLGPGSRYLLGDRPSDVIDEPVTRKRARATPRRRGARSSRS
ncbi:MAG: redox-sensitive transcriptional activator SoxR [Actinomycetota bacterium]